EENFWEMAETGPCGPDSEIHYDRGIEYCTQQDIEDHVCRVNGDCGRFLELWNLVFIQYNKVSPKELIPLPRKHVDTGMGFERIVSVLQEVDSNYKTDLFTPVLDQIQELARHADQEREESITPYRVIADHSRAAVFMIADGVVPGNTGRNYVCRMVIRRASRFGGKIGFVEPFLSEIANTIIQLYGDVYPELVRNQATILQTITDEEIRFHRTVETGLSHLEDQIEKLRKRSERALAGDIAFDLYSTYGLPLEITKDILAEENLSVDDEGFVRAMEEHRFASGSGKEGAIQPEDVELYRQILKELVEEGALSEEGVIYNPYGLDLMEGEVLALVKDGGRVESASTGDEVQVTLPQSHFYVEAGGQVSDMGIIRSATLPSWEIAVSDTRQPVDGITTHIGTVREGAPQVGDFAIVEVDLVRKGDIMRNHTATHLLHAALQKVLGDHARQAGSLVAPDRLRFDFTHSEAMTMSELQQVEEFVNQAILENHHLSIKVKNTSEAMTEGAMALFGEKYAESVRVVSVADVSMELCGGTHLRRTGEIGAFIVKQESAIGAGIRRIEALTGRNAIAYARDAIGERRSVAELLRVGTEDVEQRVRTLIGEADALQRQLKKDASKRAKNEAADAVAQAEEVGGVKIVSIVVDAPDVGALRSYGDELRNKLGLGMGIVSQNKFDKPVVLIVASDKLIADKSITAVDITKRIAKELGFRGGGKPHMAQVGIPDLNAFENLRKFVLSELDKRTR
ncbi:MAG: alanine--tRNA ligase, partial [Candidatus Krumholzibacteria bacterium]|nr:alanine--tRNA ligase [Candidatus Krumholzibacteria bacterium]